ncbi:MAG: glycosyltransferase family 2 protein [Porphyromonadaceae bacterium]|nr:MAG: glycosyltransferase family 2 protein [Porphyromonadaceae bacterium]
MGKEDGSITISSNRSMTGISIILCCHNSAERLGETLKHLADQALPENIPCELVLVNNASTDDTIELARKEWAKHPAPIVLRVVDEENPGQVFARMRGVEEAHYEMIVFCDDDNRLIDNYLSIAWSLMSRNPRVGALGGQGIAESNVPLPGWFEANKSGYACGEQWPESGICTDKMFLWGAGLVTRKNILNKVFNPGFPMLSTGRKEGVVFSGDDMEICKRIILLGYDLYYDRSLVYKHFIPESKLTLNYLEQLNAGVLLATPVQRLYSYQIIRQRIPGLLLPILFIRHSFLYLLFRLGFPVGKRKPIINVLKVYTQGIRKIGKLHQAYQQIEKFSQQQ